MRGAVTSCGGWGDFRCWPVPAMAKVCLAWRNLSEMVGLLLVLLLTTCQAVELDKVGAKI